MIEGTTDVKPQLIRGSLAALEARLADDVHAYRQSAPFAPLTILIGSTLLRPYLRRRLTELHGGLINVQFRTMRELARSLAYSTAHNNGTERLPAFGDRIIAEEVAAQASGYFERVKESPGFADVLSRLFQELRQADLDAERFTSAVAKLTATNPPNAAKLSSLADLFAAAQEKRDNFHGADDDLRLADANRFRGDHLFVYGLWSLTTLQQKLLDRLMESVEVSVYLPQGNGNADEAHQSLCDWLVSKGAEEIVLSDQERSGSTLERLRDGLFGPHADGEATFDGTVRLLSAPDPPREVREAARTCLRWAEEGIAFHEMAVVYRRPESYRALIDEVFSLTGIPIYLHDGRPLVERPAGRSLAGLLNLIGSRLTRASVMEFLTETRLPATARKRYGGFEPSAWDQISRQAAIIEGGDRWITQLEHYRRRLMTTDVQEGEPSERVANLIAEVDRFERFIGDFFPRLDDWPQRAGWESYLDRLDALAGDYVEGVGPIIEHLRALDDLKSVAEEVPFGRFMRTVGGVLQRSDSEKVFDEWSGAFGRDGVSVLDVNSLRHIRFRAVAVLGLTERAFPPPPRQDALLLDDERCALSQVIDGDIPAREKGPDPEPLQFTLAVAAARDRLQLSYARGESGGTRAHLPSYFFRAAAEALTGRPVPIATIDSLPPELFERVPANRFGAATPDGALTDGEFDRTLFDNCLALGTACLTRRYQTFARARRAWDARWRSDQLTVWDGVLDSDEQVAISRPDRSISPTRLETYATCPYRYFLQSVLRLEEVEEPETIERLSALDRGSLIHDILDQFLTQFSEALIGDVDRAHLNAELRSIAEQCCKAAEQRGEGGYPLVWEFDKAAIFEDLEQWLELELAQQSGSDLHPHAFEVRFGPNWYGDDSPADGYSVDEPLEVHFDGGTLRFHGRIDRIDWNADVSAFRVVDYKTGRSSKEGEDQFTQGQTLQLPIYLLAASHALRQHGVEVSTEAGQAEYFYATRRGEFRQVQFSGKTLERRKADFEQLLSDMTGQIARGDFHAEPGKNGDNCRYCLGREVCDRRILHLSERKAGSRDPRFLRIQDVD